MVNVEGTKLFFLPFYSRSHVKKYANLEVGDICQLKYSNKISKYYRLCIVVKTLLSEDSVIRTVIIAFNNQRSKGTQVLAKDEMEVGVQRLCLILPVSEQTLEERAWWTNGLIQCTNPKVSDVCPLKYAEDTQVPTTNEMEVGSQRLCLVLPVSKQSFEEQTWWTHRMLLWSVVVKIKNYILRTSNLK